MKRAMTCVEIIGLKVHLHDTIDVLHRLGCVHIDSIQKFPDATVRPLTIDTATVRRQEEFALLVTNVEGELNFLGGPITQLETSATHQDNVKTIRQGLDTLSPQILDFTNRREELSAELESLPRYETILLKLMPTVPANIYEEGKSVIGLLIHRNHLEALEIIRQEVMQIANGQAEFTERNIDEATRALLIIALNKDMNLIESLIGKKDVTRLRFPKQLEKGSMDDTLTALRARLQTIPAEIAEIDREIDALAEKWREKLTRWCHYLRDRLDTYQILSHVGETESTFVIMGWVPRDNLTMLQNTLREALDDVVLVAEKPLTAELKSLVPVALHNPVLVRPFETLVKIQAIPRSDGIDPTGLIALFMPIFFGMMVGDIGYGIVLLAASLGLLQRVRADAARDLLKVLALGSGWTIVFGFLFGELFGTLGEHIGLHPILFDRADEEYIISLMLLTLAIGAGHITLGLVLGVVEAIRSRSRNHLLERGGMLLGLCGVFLLVAVLVELLPAGFMTLSVATLIVGVVILSTSMGWLGILMGPIEFIGVISNLLSYLRIAAIGLASVFLAKVANDLAGLSGSVLIGLIIATLFHGLNIVLGAFSPTIQSLRLHYVEFFPKFYEGGGNLYIPFHSRLK